MTQNSTIQFVTAVKLRALRAQRGQLRVAYDRLTDQVGTIDDPYQRLRTLYLGLRDLTVAGRRLHPELTDLGIIVNESVAGGPIFQDLAQRWYDRLDGELAAGRLRSEFVFRFGALLEQWANSGGGAAPRSDPMRLRDLRGQLLAPAQPNRHRELIEHLLTGVGEALHGGDTPRPAAPDDEDATAVTVGELWPVLQALGGDPYQDASLRAEARRYAEDETLAGELADALTLLSTDQDALRWPAEGLSTRAVWTRNKWRLYTAQDLPTTCLLDVVAHRWEARLHALIGGERQREAEERRSRLERLQSLGAPTIIIENERRALARAEQATIRRALSTSEPGDVWNAEVLSPEALSPEALSPEVGSAEAGKPVSGQPNTSGAGLDDVPQSCSVLGQRRSQLAELHEVAMYDGYRDDGFSPVVALVNAEVKLARAAFPNRPVYLVKLDLRDYYASIPHDLVLTILRTIGLSANDLDLVSRFLAMPLATEPTEPGVSGDRGGNGGQVAAATQGVPMGYRLSALFAEMVGRCMEGYVQQRTPVRIIRLVDDVCLLTPDPQAAVTAWRHVTAFYEACGLPLNEDKFGAVCVGGRLPEALAGPLPRWGMLTMDGSGEWDVHEPTFQQHLAQSRRHLAAADSVLSKVDIVNADLTHLARALAVGTDLGASHRRAVSAALTRFFADYHGPGRGVTAALCEEISRLVDMPEDADQPEPAYAVPEAWLYWPVTAGGLGLRNPQVVAGQYAEAFRRADRVAAPRTPVDPGWNTRENQWADYYRSMLKPLEPATPVETVATKSLVEDFIARGTSISHGAQTSLTPYWRWILSIYGPEIRERFGTFRFLNTELVPLSLLARRRVDDRPSAQRPNRR